MSIIGRLKSDSEDDSLSDEAILNALRQKDQKVVKTSEIAEDLPIGHNWTGKRLNKLETRGRVHSKSAGQGRVWWLNEAEPEYYVSEGIGDLMWYASAAKQSSRDVWIMSIGMFIVSGLLLIPILLINVFPALTVVPFTINDFATGAMLAAVGGALFLIGGSVLKLASMSIERTYSSND